MSRRSPSDPEQVPSVVLVFNGPTEDIAPYLSERSSPESSDFDGLPPLSLVLCHGNGRQRPLLSSGEPKTQSLPMCSTQNNAAQTLSSSVLQTSPIC
ncbi:hypothetical protein NQZ68_008619 [Dissostichus eleginoides]|nr:hypothetical protein NQZ68_008619 [Dissostichus eleginoides]